MVPLIQDGISGQAVCSRPPSASGTDLAFPDLHGLRRRECPARHDNWVPAGKPGAGWEGKRDSILGGRGWVRSEEAKPQAGSSQM